MVYVAFFCACLLLLNTPVYPETTRQSTSIEEPTSLQKLCAEYDAFLLDAYGVFWESSTAGVLPGSVDAMAYLVAQGKYVGIISNSTQFAAREEEKFQKHGLYKKVHYHFIVTSGEIARECFVQENLPFATPHDTYWVFGSIHPNYSSHHRLFAHTKYREVVDLAEAGFIYIATPHIDGIDQEDPELFRKQVQSIHKQLPVLCVNPDQIAMEGVPLRQVIRQGSIARLFAEEGFTVYLIGKPSTIIYKAALQRFPESMQKNKILMIGDTPATDIRGAHGIGIDAALVTVTGIMAPMIQEEGIGQVIDHLPLTDRPEFYLKRFSLLQEE